MPQIYHAVPCYGHRGFPFVMQLLVADEGQALRPVFVEYTSEGERQRLRLLPTDGYRWEESYSLYTVRIPPEHLLAVRFSYRFCIEGEYTPIYTFPLKNVEVQLLSREDEQLPALLPLLSGEQPYLLSDAPCLRFVSFPQELVQLSVCACVGGEWQEFSALQNELGVWECHLPPSVAARAGKRLSYYVQANGRIYAARLGDEQIPLLVRLLDDTGPKITAVCVTDGEIVAENPPAIRVEYTDASGVDLSASELYLDGKSVSEKAAWTANGVSFRPEAPLGSGEHVWEIALRDTRGNRTYRRIAFLLQGEEGADSTSPKKPMSAVRAAGFFASALATLKKLFSDKE